MKVGVIGAGAMGCLFAAKLSEAGNKVLLVDHDGRTVSAIRRNCVRVREGGRLRRSHVWVRKSPGDFLDFDLVLVMVKAYSTPVVARELQGRVGHETMVLTLQNGLGNVEILSHRFDRRVLAGSTTEASLRIGPGSIEHTGAGVTLLGELDGTRSKRVLDVIRLFRSAGFKTRVTDDVQTVVWSKAIVNSAINPVSALTRLRNGELNGLVGVREFLVRVLKEGVRVAGTEGVKLRTSHLTRLLSGVLRSSAGNRSSMLQDVLNGTRTEVRELNGMIAELGRRHRIAAPLNSFLTGLVLGIERSYGEEA